MADEKIRRIFLCRHGKTEANEQRIYCGGKSESPLNKEGKNQAGLLGKALANYYNFNGKMLITSARKRAIETGKIISRYLKPKPTLLSLEGLRELELGEWCGKNADEIKKLFPKEHEEWQTGNFGPDFRFPGGESLGKAQIRIVLCFNLVKKLWLNNQRYDNSDLIIVAHGGVNMIILMEILSAEIKTYGFRTIKQDNTCLNIIGFRKKNNWRPSQEIILTNSTHHLDMDFSKIKSNA